MRNYPYKNFKVPSYQNINKKNKQKKKMIKNVYLVKCLSFKHNSKGQRPCYIVITKFIFKSGE